MPRPLPFLLLFFLPLPSAAQDPSRAAVRIHSHGASGTVIKTAPGKSWILSCAHMLTDAAGRPDPRALRGPFKMDGPHQPHAVSNQVAQARLLAYDVEIDLSLLEIDNGPFFHVPVAPPGQTPSPRLLSMGYDEMKWPLTIKPATLLRSAGDLTFTREKPWHGRSGGGLIDVENHLLIGVVQGYEVGPQGRGLYVSHQAILRFLNQAWKQPPPPAAPRTPMPYSLSSPCPPNT